MEAQHVSVADESSADKELLAFIYWLEKEKEQAVEYKYDKESVWLEDITQYHGMTNRGSRDKLDQIRGYGEGLQSQIYTPPPCNKTRPKTEIASSRIADMLFPTNRSNWDLRPSPVPEMAQMTREDPEAAEEVTKIAAAKCQRMKRIIEDQLKEAHFEKQGRMAIHDACMLGTGILKGPFIEGKIYRSYIGDEMRVVHDTKPSVTRVDPWNFFPGECRNMDECEHVFELHVMSKPQVRDLLKHPGFDEDAVNALLGIEPSYGKLSEVFSQRALITGNSEPYAHKYGVWEYHGEIPLDIMVQAGMIPEKDVDEDDNLTVVHGEIWFCQGKLLKVKMSHLPGIPRLPYYLYNYEEDPNDVFGFGIPFIMRPDQEVIDATYGAMIYNTELSAGPQIGVLQGFVEPMNGDWQIRGPKVWKVLDEEVRIEDALQMHTIPNHVENIIPLHELAKANADEVTNLPLIAQGQPTSSVQTSSGLAMLANMSNIVQRKAANSWDDNITVPMLEAFYHYNMLYSDDDEAKGPYDPIAVGASELLVKDVMAQHLQALTALSSDERFADYIDPYELLKRNLKVLDLPTEGLLKDRETVDAERQNSGPSPEEQMMQMEMEEKQNKIQVSQVELQLSQAKLEAQVTDQQRDDEYRRQERALSHDERMYEVEVRRIVSEMNIIREQIQQETEIIRLANAKDTSAQTLQTQLGISKTQEETKRIIAGINARLKAREVDLKRKNVAKGYDTYG